MACKLREATHRNKFAVLERAIAALGKLGRETRTASAKAQVRRHKMGKTRKHSAAARKRISQAQKARWAKLRQRKTAKV